MSFNYFDKCVQLSVFLRSFLQQHYPSNFLFGSYLFPRVYRIRECYRFIKQFYNMEDFRVLGYNSNHNITVMMHAIDYLASIYLEISIKLKIIVRKFFMQSKRLFWSTFILQLYHGWWHFWTIKAFKTWQFSIIIIRQLIIFWVNSR